MDVVYFESAAKFRLWLTRNHTKVTELVVGFYRKDSGLGGITYAEALDEALCVGWIDGVRRKIDDVSFSIRFTPRKRGSIWSLINVAHVARLTAAGRMRPAGLATYAARDEKKTGIYSFEKETATLPASMEKQFRAYRAAWKFWEVQPAGYRRTVLHWVTTAKREETREKRFQELLADCAVGRRLKYFTK